MTRAKAEKTSLPSTRMPRYADIFRDDDDARAIAVSSWRMAVDHLQSTGNVTDARLGIADRYARACAEFEKLYPRAWAEGPVREGPNGGDVFNYTWTAVEKLNDRIAKFEAKLKMDVAEVAPGQAVRAAATDADKYLGD